jgi:hypothetical protein
MFGLYNSQLKNEMLNTKSNALDRAQSGEEKETSGKNVT